MIAETREPFRALFLSDIHLGTRASQAESLLDFLKVNDAEVIYLVGDIIDFWKIKRSAHWPQTHNDVLQKLLRKVRKGTKIIFIPGNHDEPLRDYVGFHFGGIEVHRQYVHTSAAGKKYLILHGDEFDVVLRTAKWLAFLGDRGYELALTFNMLLNWMRRHFGFGYWSLSAYLKYRVKQAVQYIGAFEDAVTHEAQRRDVSGVICGHIHHAADQQMGAIHYLNCGDWVESCTAIAETRTGEFRLIRWNGMTERRSRPVAHAEPAEAA